MEDEIIYLFRLRLFDSSQENLFERMTREEIFESSLESKNKYLESYGSTWRFGNFKKISQTDYCFFRIGKVFSERNERYEGADFDESISEKGISTKALLNIKLGILGIYQNRDLAQNTETIAKRTAELIDSMGYAVANGYNINVSQISDPKDFISLVNGAKQITSVEIRYKARNPPDVGMFFHEQLESGVDMLSGASASTKVSGDNLRKEPIIEMAKSSSKTGDALSAKIKSEGQTRAVWRKMGSNPATVAIPANSDLYYAIEEVNNYYEEINNEN